MTLFNEPLVELQRSLSSLAANLGQTARVPPLGIALVLDGLLQAHAEVLAWLQQQGFAVDLPYCDDWQQCTLAPSAWQGQAATGDATLPVWLYIKRENRGKLDSHAVFFETLCRALQPEIVFQLDVGTTLGPQALQRTLAHFVRSPQVGALSSRCAAQAPEPNDGFVRAWQFFDTTAQLATVWPTEELCGQLSVIPGQFCALRWSALTHAPAGAITPLQRYLRGLSTSSRFERTMFLAEDRVIGQALTLAEGAAWKLTYGDDVEATNDACETLPELMRQRRRWNNGANACRVALLARWPEILRQRERSFQHKAHVSAGLGWQALQLLQQVLGPGALLCTLWLMAVALRTAWGQGHHALCAMMVAGGLVGTAASLVSSQRLAQVAWWCATLGCGLVMGLSGLSLNGMALMFGPPVLTLALIAWRYPQHFALILRRGPQHLWCDGLMRLLLWGYSLYRLGDVSWGTKGLHHARHSSRWWHNPAWWALPTWVGLNLAVAWDGVTAAPSLDGTLAMPWALTLVRWIALGCAIGGGLHLLRPRGPAVWRSSPWRTVREQGRR